MTRWCSLAARAVVALALLGMVMGQAEAYLDPGTGSFLLQLLIGAVLGAGFAVKMGWHRITGFLGRLLGRKDSEAEDPCATVGSPDRAAAPGDTAGQASRGTNSEGEGGGR